MCKVAVIGYGVVGSGTVELFMKNRESISKKVGKECDIKYILDLRDFPDSPFNASIFFSLRIFSKIRSPSCFILVTRNPPFISMQKLLYSSLLKTYYIGVLLSRVYIS